MKNKLHNKFSFQTAILFCVMGTGLVRCIGKSNNAENHQNKNLKPSFVDAISDPYQNQVALYLSGMRQNDTNDFNSYEKSNSWKKYATISDSSWTKLKREKIIIMSDWAKDQIQKQACKPETVFYPFSGPDFLHAVTLFPDAKNYILIGLEPIGSIPTQKELQKDSLKGFFQAAERSLRDVLNFSFFKTNNMAVDLKSKEVDGSLPLLYIFLKRTGNDILSVDTLSYKASGMGADLKSKTSIHGIKITFRKEGQEKTLYYFSADLTDYVFQKHISFLKFLDQFNNVSTFLKSASYLLYRPNFSLIKKTILDKSDFILEDDSGISYKDFKDSQWNLQFYGKYMIPIYLFTNFYDIPLHERFKKEAKVLPFGIGYHWRENESNLIFAIKKQI